MLASQQSDLIRAFRLELKRKEAAYRSEQQTREHRPRRPLRAWLDELRTKPPRCIAPVAEPVTSSTLSQLRGHTNTASIAFNITTPRDRPGLTVYGRAHAESDSLDSPIRVGSLNPARSHFTFDLSRDGWDGEYGNGPDRFRGRLSQLACPRCDGRHFRLTAAFEYPDDLDELDDREKSHPEDFFTWFWLFARCAACNWSDIVADIECA